jgi:hypothetical protein
MYFLSKKLMRTNMTPTNRFVKLFVGVVLCALSHTALAQQRIVGADRKQMEVIISEKEHNDITIVGGVVSQLKVVKGKLDYKRDSKGALSFVLMGDDRQTISVTIVDEDANRYNLLLVPKPVPQQDIVLVPPSGSQPSVEDPSGDQSPAKHTTSYTRKLKRFAATLVSQLKSGVVAGMSRQEVNQIIPLWKEARLTYRARYIDGDFVGEHYELTNISLESMQIVEAELMRPGVVGIYLAKQSLDLSKTTDLIVVRERTSNE